MVLREDAAERIACGRAFGELCTWAATTSLDEVPPDVRQRACLVLSDDIAAIVAAATEPEVAAVQAQLAASSGSPAAATLLGRTPCRVDRHTAAAANGMAICWSELDEGYRLAACHAGAYIIPALIAEAEATGARTQDVIASAIACCQYAHSAVEATLALRAAHPAVADPANVAAILVATHPMGENPCHG